MGSSPTMKDVAREAGVALGTVSRVFNGMPVGEEYRIKVLDAAERLGYKVNTYARGLKASRTNMIAVIMPSLTHPFYAEITESISRTLRARGLNMLVSITAFDPQAEEKCIDLMQQNKVDGIICLSYNPDLRPIGNMPFVSIDRYYSACVPCVAADNYGGGQLAAQKLIEFGCHNLLVMRKVPHLPGETDKRDLGFLSYCQSQHVAHEIFTVDAGNDDQEFFDFLDQHMENGHLKYDGIFCGTDLLGYHVLKHLKKRGISVPEEVQIIGFDGIRKFGDGDYYVSTIVQPVEEMAKACVDIIMSENHDSLPALMCLPVTYAYGGTTIA